MGCRYVRASTKHSTGEKGGRKYVNGFSEPLQSGLADNTEVGGTKVLAGPSCAAEDVRGRAEGLTAANGFTTMS